MKRIPSDQHERENAFGRSCVRLRKSMGLTQRALGRLLGISEQAIGHWERGVRSPKLEHLKRLLALCHRRHAFTPGREHEEAQQLWRAAGKPADFDAFWMQVQLAAPSASHALVLLKREAAQPVELQVSQETSAASSRFDWGDALDVRDFYGREAERLLLEQWVVMERCQMVSVLGMGGIGKSALAVTLMHHVAPSFQTVVFRSVRDAPLCEDLLADCLQVLAPRPLRILPTSVERGIDQLLESLQARRCLLVLDNLETLLQAHDPESRYLPGYEDYGALLRRVAETAHQSCLLLTSRESPADLVPLGGSRTPVRALRLSGLDAVSCEQLLEEKDVAGATPERERLIERYGGNPLALKIVAETIVELFGGEIAPFLEQGEVVFGSVRELLGEQFARLSAAEQSVLLWLAIVREPVTIEELLSVLATPLLRAQVLDVVEALQRRSLLERGKRRETFTLQSVVLEYATARLIAEASSEIEQGRLVRLIEHGLVQANAKEYVRQTQQRLIVAPLLVQLWSVYQGRAAVEECLFSLLDQLRTQADDVQGYGPANLLALLRELRGHLRGLDLSQVSIRGTSLQGVEMQDTTLSGATLRDTTFTQAFDASWAVAISSNGTYWAAGSRRGEVRVWREAGQMLHLAWQAHTGEVPALAFSPDGRTLASGSWDGIVKLWDLERGALLWTSSQTNSIQSLAFAPDGRTLASGGLDAVVRLWDAQLGTNLQTLSGHSGPVYALAWSPDGSLLASGGFDGGIRLWEMQGAQPGTGVRILAGHTDWVKGLAFAPDGRTLTSGSFDRTVKLWDVASGGLRETLAGHTNRVGAVAWSPDGRILASCSLDQTIWLWDVERSSYQMVLHGHTAGVYGIAFTPDSRSLLSGSDDGTLRVWEMESGQCVHIIQGYAVSLYDVTWSPDGIQLASAGTDMLVTIWDSTGRTPHRVLRGHRYLVYGVAWSPDGRWLASSGWDNAVRLWDATTGAAVQILRDPNHVDTIFFGVAWSPGGKFLAGASSQHGVQVWDVTTGTCRWVGRGQQTRIRRVAWSPDGTRLASCGDDGSVFLWDASDGTVRASLQGHRGNVMSVAWSPDGTRLASGGGGRGELFVWEVQSGECLFALNEPSAMVNAVAWSPTEALLVSGGSDGMLRWWNVHSRECVRVRKGHQGAIQSLKVSPDRRRLASCGDDGVINVWDLEIGERVRTLRRDRPYERLDISGVQGLTEAQRASLRALGAVEVKEMPREG